MDHAATVRVGERGAHLVDDGSHQFEWQYAMRAQHVLERLPLDELHHEEVQIFHLPHRMHRDDVGMLEIRDRDRLLPEAFDHAGTALRAEPAFTG